MRSVLNYVNSASASYSPREDVQNREEGILTRVKNAITRIFQPSVPYRGGLPTYDQAMRMSTENQAPEPPPYM